MQLPLAAWRRLHLRDLGLLGEVDPDRVGVARASATSTTNSTVARPVKRRGRGAAARWRLPPDGGAGARRRRGGSPGRRWLGDPRARARARPAVRGCDAVAVSVTRRGRGVRAPGRAPVRGRGAGPLPAAGAVATGGARTLRRARRPAPRGRAARPRRLMDVCGTRPADLLPRRA